MERYIAIFYKYELFLKLSLKQNTLILVNG